MRAIVQRVKSASVVVEGNEIARIGNGFAVLLGVEKNDGEAQAKWTAEKIANLRIFEDEDGKMNLSILDVKGEALVVSQFTLYGDVRRGRRPGFDRAAPPDHAEKIYERFIELLRDQGVPVQTGKFQAAMLFTIENWGPVTIIVETDRGI